MQVTQPGAHLLAKPCTCLEDLFVRGFHSGLSLGRPQEIEEALLRFQRKRIEVPHLAYQPGRFEDALDGGRVDVALVLSMSIKIINQLRKHSNICVAYWIEHRAALVPDVPAFVHDLGGIEFGAEFETGVAHVGWKG